MHGHHHVPFAKFGLYQVAPDGSVGAPVSISPKIGFCIADSVTVGSLPHHGVFGYGWDACANASGIVGISVDGVTCTISTTTGSRSRLMAWPMARNWFRAMADPLNYFAEQVRRTTSPISSCQLSG